MYKRLLLFCVSLLTFSIGVGISSLRPTRVRCRHQSTTTYKLQVQRESFDPGSTRSYHPGNHVFSQAADGHEACFGSFSSSDGMSFSQDSEFYDSPKQAKTELLRRLRRAVKIIKREPILDEQGRAKGEKVIATFSPSDDSNGVAEILWTDGGRFTYIRGTSLQNILEYEKDANARWH